MVRWFRLRDRLRYRMRNFSVRVAEEVFDWVIMSKVMQRCGIVCVARDRFNEVNTMKTTTHTAKDFSSLAQRGLEKIVVNTGIGRLSQIANFTDKILPEVIAEFAALTGQKPSLRAARQSIAGFKMRAGAIVGLQATLRRRRMVDFLARLIHVVIPRVRDFRGIPLRAMDQHGNLTIGVKEHIVFPEISSDATKTNFGLQVTMVPRSQKSILALDLYKQLGVPLEHSK